MTSSRKRVHPDLKPVADPASEEDYKSFIELSPKQFDCAATPKKLAGLDLDQGGKVANFAPFQLKDDVDSQNSNPNFFSDGSQSQTPPSAVTSQGQRKRRFPIRINSGLSRTSGIDLDLGGLKVGNDFSNSEWSGCSMFPNTQSEYSISSSEGQQSYQQDTTGSGIYTAFSTRLIQSDASGVALTNGDLDPPRSPLRTGSQPQSQPSSCSGGTYRQSIFSQLRSRRSIRLEDPDDKWYFVKCPVEVVTLSDNGYYEVQNHEVNLHDVVFYKT